MNLSISHMRWGAFIVALAIYAALGSPTADHPGSIEVLIAGLLFVSLGFFLSSPAVPLLAYSLTVSVLLGAVQGAASIVIARDVVGLLFLGLPVFFSGLVAEDRRQKVFILVCTAMGLIFSLRTLGVVYGWLPMPDELLYLANSPLVLFSALLFIGRAFDDLAEASGPTKIVAAILYVLAALFPMAAMLVDVQRAGFAAIAMTILFHLIRLIYRHPVRAVMPVAVLALALWAGWTQIETIYTAAMTKTSNVGLNMRLEEAKAVLNALSGGWMDMLLGRGWGAVFASPAVGGVTVSYTHSLVTYFLLKTGLVGLGLAGFYLFYAGRGVWGRLTADPALAVAVIWPLLIPVFFYASHKSLDFGLILMLALLPAARRVV